jgi:hypothetical protein
MPNEMTRAVFLVTVDVDPDDWQLNYGSASDVVDADIGHYMQDVTRELLEAHLKTTGNTGRVTVVRQGRVKRLSTTTRAEGGR